MSRVTAHPAFMTVEEFEAYPFPDGKVELVRGEPRVNPPAGLPHGTVGSNIIWRLMSFVNDRRLGRVYPDSLGYELVALAHTVRNPDVSFVRADRVPAAAPRGFFKLAPDLAVEVLSPSDTARELEEKVEDYLAAGTPLIWVINPDRRTVRVVAGDGSQRFLGADGVLDGGAVLPGFECRVADLFEGLA